jgi:Cu/Ag efflux pump CusA
MELRTLLDWVVNPRLRTVPGVVEVNSFGGELRTYQVTLDPRRLTSHGLSVVEHSSNGAAADITEVWGDTKHAIRTNASKHTTEQPGCFSKHVAV